MCSAILPGHSSDSAAKALCTTCPRGLHCLYSTVQRTGSKKTRNGGMGNLSIQDRCFSAAWVTKGLLLQHFSLIGQLQLQTRTSYPANKDFLPVVQTLFCSRDSSVSVELSCSFRSWLFTLVLTLKTHATFLIKKCTLVLSWNQS